MIELFYILTEIIFIIIFFSLPILLIDKNYYAKSLKFDFIDKISVFLIILINILFLFSIFNINLKYFLYLYILILFYFALKFPDLILRRVRKVEG